MTDRFADREVNEEQQGPVVHDRRRIDPLTGALRPSEEESVELLIEGAEGLGSTRASAGSIDDNTLALAERTADLQRVQAEYTNYRRRVERDRDVARDQATVSVLNELLPVLDDIGRAREHDELVGGFKSVGEALEAVVAKLGLRQFGTVGEPFDPEIHEALTHRYSADVEVPTCTEIYQPGYRFGDRVVRPARVGVAEPGGDEAPEVT